MKRIILGIVLIIIGLFTGYMYMQTSSFAFAFLTLTLPAGIAILYFAYKGTGGISLNLSGISLKKESEPEKKINAINFYAIKKENGMEKALMCKFEHLDSPGGIPFKHRKWGEEFYINVSKAQPKEANIEIAEYIPIFEKLPDQDFHSPEALVKAAYLPANTNLALHSNDKEYKLSAWILFAIIVVEIIGLVIIP